MNTHPRFIKVRRINTEMTADYVRLPKFGVCDLRRKIIIACFFKDTAELIFASLCHLNADYEFDSQCEQTPTKYWIAVQPKDQAQLDGVLASLRY